jgi:hypothetical protein
MKKKVFPKITHVSAMTLTPLSNSSSISSSFARFVNMALRLYYIEKHLIILSMVVSFFVFFFLFFGTLLLASDTEDDKLLSLLTL